VALRMRMQCRPPDRRPVWCRLEPPVERDRRCTRVEDYPPTDTVPSTADEPYTTVENSSALAAHEFAWAVSSLATEHYGDPLHTRIPGTRLDRRDPVRLSAVAHHPIGHLTRPEGGVVRPQGVPVRARVMTGSPRPLPARRAGATRDDGPRTLPGRQRPVPQRPATARCAPSTWRGGPSTGSHAPRPSAPFQ
jgi:hypothetical protein